MTKGTIVKLAAITLMAGFLTGCETSSLQRDFKVGDVERVRYANSQLYKNWVEMPNKEPSEPNTKETRYEMVLRQKVVSIGEDGSAILEVTIEKALLNIISNVNKKKTDMSFVSSKGKVKSDWPGERKIDGASYRIKMKPNTEVVEVIGLDKLHKKLNLKEDSRAGWLLSEKQIKMYHEREFVKNAPSKVGLGKKYQKASKLPHNMIKAKALEYNYTPVEIIEKNGVNLAVVNISGEALQTLPEGVEEVKGPGNFFQSFLIEKSDMQEFKITGKGLFDLTTGKARKENRDIDILLLLDGDKMNLGNPKSKDNAKGSGGKMFTVIKMHQTFETLAK